MPARPHVVVKRVGRLSSDFGRVAFRCPSSSATMSVHATRFSRRPSRGRARRRRPRRGRLSDSPGGGRRPWGRGQRGRANAPRRWARPDSGTGRPAKAAAKPGCKERASSRQTRVKRTHGECDRLRGEPLVGTSMHRGVTSGFVAGGVVEGRHDPVGWDAQFAGQRHEYASVPQRQVLT